MPNPQPYRDPPPMPSRTFPDGTPKPIGLIDAEWQAHIRELQAYDVAQRTGKTPEAVKAEWDAENALKPTEASIIAAGLALRDRLESQFQDAVQTIQNSRNLAPRTPRPLTPKQRRMLAASPRTLPKPTPTNPSTPPPSTGTGAGTRTNPSPPYTISVDFRGETLTYAEPTRETSCQFFWTRNYQIHTSTFTPWSNTNTPLTEQEKALVVERIVHHARTVQNVDLQVRE